uniref:Uncharacterized protein n=1 Tax=Phlebotomus papatasi TaxID=29031 RepID=A0A1B0GNJ8_PHLPP
MIVYEVSIKLPYQFLLEQKDKLKNLHEAAHSLTMAMAEFEDNLVRTNTKMKIQLVNNGDPRLSSDPSGINSNIHPTIESIFLVLRKLLPPPSFAEALNLYREVQSSPNWRQIEASLPNFWSGDGYDIPL